MNPATAQSLPATTGIDIKAVRSGWNNFWERRGIQQPTHKQTMAIKQPTQIERIAAQAAVLLSDLLIVNGDKILETWAASDDAKVQLSTAIALEGTANSPLVKVRLSFSHRYTDEAEVRLDDPAQAKLKI